MFVLTIDDEYGMAVIELFDTQEKAKAYLAEWCRKVHEDDSGIIRENGDEFIPLPSDDEDAIESYFANHFITYDIQHKEPNPTN